MIDTPHGEGALVITVTLTSSPITAVSSCTKSAPITPNVSLVIMVPFVVRNTIRSGSLHISVRLCGTNQV